MNIVKTIGGKDEEVFSFEYYGVQDFGTFFDVRYLVENKDKIKKYFSKEYFTVNSQDDFIDYLFLRKFAQFDEVVPLVREDFKNDTEQTVNFVKETFAKYKKGELIKYIKDNAEAIITDTENKQVFIISEILEIVGEAAGGLDNILQCFVKNKPYMLISRYSIYQKSIERDAEIFKEFFSANTFETIKWNRCDDFFGIIAHYINSKRFIKELTPLIVVIKDYGLSIYNQITDDNIIQFDHIFKGIKDFLCKIKSEYANDFVAKNKTLAEVNNRYLEKHGHSHSTKIPFDEMLKPFQDESLHWQIKLMMLTHQKNKKGKMQHYYKTIMEDKKKSFSDMACTPNCPTNDFFTMSKQMTLNLYDDIYLRLLHYFITEERIAEFFGWFIAELKYVYEKYALDLVENDVENDINILLNMFIDLLKASKEKKDFSYKGLCYGTSMFICGQIEKLLRNIYGKICPEPYVDLDWYSLGGLLDYNRNTTICKLLGEDELRCIQYYLHKDQNGNVGFNYRNNLAHYKNMKTDNFQFGLPLHIMQLYLSIVNIIAYNSMESKKTKK